MEELKFALKCMVFSVAIVLVMQLPMGETTMEERADLWIHTTPIPKYLQQVAFGAIKVGNSVKEIATKEMSKLSRHKTESTSRPKATDASDDSNEE